MKKKASTEEGEGVGWCLHRHRRAAVRVVHAAVVAPELSAESLVLPSQLGDKRLEVGHLALALLALLLLLDATLAHGLVVPLALLPVGDVALGVLAGIAPRLFALHTASSGGAVACAGQLSRATPAFGYGRSSSGGGRRFGQHRGRGRHNDGVALVRLRQQFNAAGLRVRNEGKKGEKRTRSEGDGKQGEDSLGTFTPFLPHPTPSISRVQGVG